jgi:ribosomal protein L7Ae-like RNA K-turn-binding protein
MINRFDIKRQLMKEDLQTGELGIANVLLFVDSIVDVYNWEFPTKDFNFATLYYKNLDVDRVLAVLESKETVMTVDLSEEEYMFVIEQALEHKNVKHVYLMDDIEIRNGRALEFLYELAENPLENIVVVVVDSQTEISKFFPVFMLKKPTMTGSNVATPYFRYFGTLGQGFGRMEGKERARSAKVTKKLFADWEKNIAEAEKQYNELLNKKNEN